MAEQQGFRRDGCDEWVEETGRQSPREPAQGEDEQQHGSGAKTASVLHGGGDCPVRQSMVPPAMPRCTSGAFPRTLFGSSEPAGF